MSIVLGVGVVITDSQGRVLLSKRLSEHGRGMYSIPGGKVDVGESIDDAALREIHEETGLALNQLKFLGLSNNLSTYTEEGIHSVSVIYHCDDFQGEVKLKEPESHECWQWIDIRDGLPEPHFEASRNALTLYQEGVVSIVE